MADEVSFRLADDMHSMPLLVHLEELRKRIIFSIIAVVVGFFSCWYFADRIFGLMQRPIIQALRHHGLGGGLVYLNPTEPFNIYLEVAFVAGLFVSSPFVFYQLWLFIAPGLRIARKVSRFRHSCSALVWVGSLLEAFFGWMVYTLWPLWTS